MATFGSTITRILSDLNRGDISDRAKTAIVEAIDFYAARRFAFNTTRSSTSTQTAVEYISLPTNWVELDYLRLEEDGNQTTVLDEKNTDWMDERGTGSADLGEPVAYAISQRSLRLWPIPDASYSIQLSYQCLLPEVSISASADATNAWLTEGFQVIYNHAMADLLGTYIRGDEAIAGAAVHQEREQYAVRELERRANREQGTGHLRGCL